MTPRSTNLSSSYLLGELAFALWGSTSGTPELCVLRWINLFPSIE